MFPKFRKFGLSAVLLVFVFISVAGFLFSAQPVRAQFGGSVTVVEDLTIRAQMVLDKIKEGLKVAVVNATVRAVDYFLRKVAYDLAVWTASGGKGQNPFAHSKSFGDYMSNVANEAAGVAIEQLGKPFGLNLCKIPDVRVDLALRLGLQFRYAAPPKPSCTFSDFQKNWSAASWQSQYSGKALENRFNASFKVEQSDLGLALSASEKIDNLIAKQTAAAQLQRQEGQGFKPATRPISGDIKTPASAVKKTAESNTPDTKVQASQQQVGSGIASGVYQTLPGTLSLFLNTLAGQMLKNFMEKGMLPFGIGCVGDKCPKTTSNLAAEYEALETGGRQAAQEMFSSLLVPKTSEIDRYDILANLSNCPDNPGADNCVADENFVQAAQEADYGAPVTIAEAITKNWLHGDWKLISPDRQADNADKNCYSRAYCYANIKKLRKVRIVSLGFEIAALYSNPDKPWTLKQVMDGFNDCNYIKDQRGNIVGIQNDPVNKPFCHLIDPNWVLKAPPSRCNVVAYGPSLLLSAAPNRQEECVDLSSCVSYDKDGNCAVYGYCAREKNVWRVDADKCDSQYRTCRSFQNSEGKMVSYLYRTLDTGFCNQDNAGCAAYSLKKEYASATSGAWVGYDEDYINFGENSAIYFNSQLSSNCSADSAGCSAFKVASTSDTLYLRKAPYYAKCYDADLAVPGIQWPETAADLARLRPAEECKNYSQACIPDEVNCNWYESITYFGDKIPGRFTPATVDNGQIIWNDQCDQRCVGYNAYREMPSNYSNGQSVAYIIPSSGTGCSAPDEGCTAFTNLSTTTAGLEKVEYFSYLRPCILPDANKQKKFYTYEGSMVGGYQLKVYILEKDTDGSPKYFYRTDDDRRAYNSICSEALYRSGLASLDCRQFNDEKGSVYYKLLSKTIAVSDQCTPYRLNNPELYPIDGFNQSTCQNGGGYWDASASKCKFCFQDGEYRDGQCFYSGLAAGVPNTAGISYSCSASVNSCRAYKGNTGNNIRTIFADNFEGGAATSTFGWEADNGVLAQSAESTHAGEHSLSYTGSDSFDKKDLDLTPGKSYDLAFWAKGSSGLTVAVSLRDHPISPPVASTALGTVSAGDIWQYFHLGPVELKGTVTTTDLVFSVSGQGQVFLDNVRLIEVTDYIYLVKNTLKVDPVCDSNLNDNLPGEALGCAEYKTPDNSSIYLTGFSYLCRENAIGCTALYDTYNTPDDPDSAVYNVWFSGLEGTMVAKTINGKNYSCQIPIGQNGCYVNIRNASLPDIRAAGRIVSSTIYIPPDTVSTTPIYLVADQEATCNSADLGCVNAGRVKDTPNGAKYEDALIRNDPADYDTALCQSEAVGCNAFAYGDGTMYFKDPALVGQKICGYRNEVEIGGAKYSGWFWKGVGVCEQNRSKFCSDDADCATGEGKCADKDLQACYPDYLRAGNIYDIWSYGVAGKYKNFVGECPAEQDGCTEYVDHNDNDKPYYIINNDSLKPRLSDCNGQASQKYGCILFDQTDLPNKLWNTTSTYLASKQKNEALVTPTSSPNSADNNANVILKVTRDRECGEWLQCRSSHRVWDVKKGAFKEVCDMIGRCDKSPEAANKSDITNCDEWVDGLHRYANQVLADDLYRNRDISWKGMDFSGYSLFNIYPLEELTEVNFGLTDNSPEWRLVKRIPCGEPQYCRYPDQLASYLCNSNQSGVCGRGGQGACVLAGQNLICVRNPDGTTADIKRVSPNQSCRAYPEEGAPFPNTQNLKTAQGFANANYCAESGADFTSDRDKAYACECDYTKVSYGEGEALIKYWNFNSPNNSGILNKNGALMKGVVGGICLGGKNSGKACDADEDCGEGSCEKAKKQTRYIGWRGYCLEPDISRPLYAEESQNACLTWYPVDSITGAPDINGQNREAGYVNPVNGGRYYCLEGNKVMGYAGGGGSGGPFYFEWIARPNVDAAVDVLKIDTNGIDAPPAKNMEKDGSQYIRAFVPAHPNNGEQGLRLPDIEKIQFTVGDHDTEDPRKGTVFEIWPNDNTAPVGTPQAVFRLNTEGGDVSPIGHAITGRYLGKPNEFILMYSSATKQDADPVNDTHLKDDGSVCYGGEEVLTCSNLSGNILQDGTLKTSNNRSLGAEGMWNQNVSMADICPGTNSYSGNWHAVRLEFDKNTGKFLGYYVAYCDDSHGSGHIKYNVKFRVRQWCDNVLDMSVDIGSNQNGARAVAWTDRLWQKSIYSIRDLGGPELTDWVGYDYLINRSPFGSISQNTQPVNPVVISPVGAMPRSEGECNPCPVQSDGTTYECSCNYNLTKPIQVSGAPYSCNYYNGSGCIMSTDSGGVKKSQASNFLLNQGQWAIAKIFASVYADLEYNFASSTYIPSSTYYVTNNYTEKGDKNICPYVNLGGNSVQACSGLEPTSTQVRSLNVRECVAGRCSEGDPGITVNDESSGDVISTTHLIPVSVKFFAFADANQMPLKKVIVDWNDGTVTALDGYYRNRRGVVDGTCKSGTCRVPATDYLSALSIDSRTSVSVDTGKTCTRPEDCKNLDQCFSEDKAPNFGQIADKTCDNSYFRFDHVYQCLQGGQGWATSTCPNDDFKARYGGCCVFQPRVQVKDNWGWCNGVCKDNDPNTDDAHDTSPGRIGCYDKGWNGTSYDECGILDFGSFTPFSGNIIIAP